MEPTLAEQPAQSDSAAKLVEAIRAVVAEGGISGTATLSGTTTQSPGAWNIFFFVLLIVNLVFLVALIPPNLLEELHWDLVKELIPIVGGSFFVVFASWYQDLTLKIMRSWIFRGIDIAFSLWFLIFLMPWIRITPNIQPVDAETRYVQDDNPRPIEARKPIHLSLKEHQFTVEWGDDENEQRTFNVGSWRLLLAEFGGSSAQPYWPRLYKVVVIGDGAPVIKVKIMPTKGTTFDADFLGSDIQKHLLHREDDGSITLTLPNLKDAATGTWLPFGTYTMTPSRRGCRGVPQVVTIGPEPPQRPIDLLPISGCTP
jgi:hypothetical protein